MIRVVGLGKSYETAAGLFPALKGVSLEIQPGDFIAVMGPSGSGKSTFVRMINGLIKPTAGRVTVDGLDTDRDGKAVRRRVGFCFTDPDAQILMPTVAEDLAFGLRGRGPSRDAVTDTVEAALAAYDLHRGLQTLPVRVRAQQDNAIALAGWLAGHPAVERVHYPGMPGADPEGLLGRQLAGPGAVLAIALRGGFDAAADLVTRTRLVTHAVSLGGVDSLLQHPASLTHRPVAAEAKPHPNVVRISVGLEDVRDVIADFDQALRGVGERRLVDVLSGADALAR